MRRFDFDTVLVAMNAADVHSLSFIQTVLPEAARRGMGVIGMKVCAAGALVGPGRLTVDEAMGYVLSLAGVSNVIIGCKTPAEVDENAAVARKFAPFADDRMRTLERRTGPAAAAFTSYKMA
jgi:predicted aldo/keto reductase-like oxidoreductase